MVFDRAFALAAWCRPTPARYAPAANRDVFVLDLCRILSAGAFGSATRDTPHSDLTETILRCGNRFDLSPYFFRAPRCAVWRRHRIDPPRLRWGEFLLHSILPRAGSKQLRRSILRFFNERKT